MASPVSGQGSDYHGIPTPELRIMASGIQVEMNALAQQIFQAGQARNLSPLKVREEYESKKKEFSIITTELAGRPDIYANMSTPALEKLKQELIKTVEKLSQAYLKQKDSVSIADIIHMQAKMDELVIVYERLSQRKASEAIGKITNPNN